jgi:hypothetical protein
MQPNRIDRGKENIKNPKSKFDWKLHLQVWLQDPQVAVISKQDDEYLDGNTLIKNSRVDNPRLASMKL